MSRKGTASAFGYIDILNSTDFEKVKQGVYSVLEHTGVVVKSQKMRQCLKNYGCRVDNALERVYFDREIVDRAIGQTPDGFTISAREEKNKVHLQPGKTTQFINGCGTAFFDMKTQTAHVPTRKEFYDYLKLLDVLPNVDFQNCFPFFGFAHVPECMKLLESVAAKYRVSTKAQIEGTVFDNYRFSTEMAKVMGVDLCQIVNSAAPLTYFEETADQIFNYTDAGLPFHFAAGPTRGLTSPMGAAGSVISNNAEGMAGLVMAQAARPGSRVWMNSMIMTPDMSTGKPAFGDIGNSYTDMAFNQYWRHYHVPCWSNAASWTSAKSADYQAGYEQSMALMTQVLSGSTVISFQGGMYAERYSSPVKAVMDDDIVGMTKRLLGGLDTSEEGLAVESIQEIGPMPGSFMDTDETLENWREECYVPTVGSRQTYEEWIATGRKTIVEKAQERADSLLEKAKVPQLDAQKEQALEDILNEARNYYYKQGRITEDEWKEYQEDIHSDTYPYA